MVLLVLAAQTAKNGDGLIHVRLRNRHLLEATLECSVLLNRLLDLFSGGRSDAPKQPAAERGLQDGRTIVCGGRRGAEVVNVVDEHHHGALLCSLDNLGDNDGESLLNLAGHWHPAPHCPEVKLKQTKRCEVVQGRLPRLYVARDPPQ